MILWPVSAVSASQSEMAHPSLQYLLATLATIASLHLTHAIGKQNSNSIDIKWGKSDIWFIVIFGFSFLFVQLLRESHDEWLHVSLATGFSNIFHNLSWYHIKLNKIKSSNVSFGDQLSVVLKAFFTTVCFSTGNIEKFHRKFWQKFLLLSVIDFLFCVHCSFGSITDLISGPMLSTSGSWI